MNYEFPNRKIDLLPLQKECHSPHHCEHPDKEIRRKKDKNGNPRFYYQCLCCGCTAGKQLKKAEVLNPESVKDFEVDRENQAWADYNQRFEKRRKLEVKMVEDIWNRNRDLYMNSPEWKKLRALVFERANYICEGCREAKATDCHHTTYDNIGQEFLFELLALCKECHDRYHAQVYPKFLKDLHSELLINMGKMQVEPVE